MHTRETDLNGVEQHTGSPVWLATSNTGPVYVPNTYKKAKNMFRNTDIQQKIPMRCQHHRAGLN